MRRSSALMAQLEAQSRKGTTLGFERCAGGNFSSDLQYALRVEGKTIPPAQRNLYSMGDMLRCSSWPYGAGDSDEVQNMLEPNKTYTLSFDAEGIDEPPQTVFREDCCYDYDTGEPTSCGELERCSEHPGLGFVLVPSDAISPDWGLGLPGEYELPLVNLFVEHEIKAGEKFHGTVTFTTPDTLEGYSFQVLTNQYYYSHYMYPEIWNSTVSFTNIKIEEGDTETPYIPYGQEPSAEEKCVRAGTEIVCGDSILTAPCDLFEGDVWYPTEGVVEKAEGFFIRTEKQSAAAPKGSFEVTQNAIELEATLSATLLAKRV